MVVSGISIKNRGLGVGAFFFFATVAGMISTTLLGYLADELEAKDHPIEYAHLLGYFTVIPYALSVPFFFLAGRSYRANKLAEL